MPINSHVKSAFEEPGNKSFPLFQLVFKMSKLRERAEILWKKQTSISDIHPIVKFRFCFQKHLTALSPYQDYLCNRTCKSGPNCFGHCGAFPASFEASYNPSGFSCSFGKKIDVYWSRPVCPLVRRCLKILTNGPVVKAIVSSMGIPDTGHKKPQKLKVLKTIEFKVFFQNRSLKSGVFQFRPQKPQNLKSSKPLILQGFASTF